MKVLITGGAGYIGFSLAEALSKRKDVEEIVVFDSLVRRNYALFTQGSFDKKGFVLYRANSWTTGHWVKPSSQLTRFTIWRPRFPPLMPIRKPIPSIR